MTRERWTNDQDIVLMDAYMRGGISACRQAFPMADDNRLKNRVRKLSLRNGGIGRTLRWVGRKDHAQQ